MLKKVLTVLALVAAVATLKAQNIPFSAAIWSYR